MTIKTNKSLIGLATGKKKVRSSKKVENERTPEEERDIKAKMAVEKLLEDVSLITEKKDSVNKTPITSIRQDNAEWLQEQVSLLSAENENMRFELSEAKENYAKIYADFKKSRETGGNSDNDYLLETIKQNVIWLFNDVQNNLMGNNPERQQYTTIDSKIFLEKKMIPIFAFTESFKRFK